MQLKSGTAPSKEKVHEVKLAAGNSRLIDLQGKQFHTKTA